ncbi:MAG: ABC-type transport auxiliary lipoprotein family protein [Ramlibacter sp.]
MIRTTLACSALALCLAGCSALPEKPVRATLYDFGPGALTAASTGQLPPLVLADVDTPGGLEGTAMHYRLGYADPQQLRPYAQARWSAPPPQLVRQRLRQVLNRDRAVLDPGDSAGLARSGGASPRVLRVDLEEFSHLFDSTTDSSGLLRLRATLMENTAAGEKLLAQRSFVVRRPAPSPDAPGGARALAAATDAAADEIGQWLVQQR